MLSSLAVPTVYIKPKSAKVLRSCNVTSSMMLSSLKIILFDRIFCAGEESATKSKLSSNLNPCEMSIKCGLGRPWTLKVKPKLGCYSNIPPMILHILVLFLPEAPKIDGAISFEGSKSRSNLVTSICDLYKSYFIRPSLVMYSLEIRLRYAHFFRRFWP